VLSSTAARGGIVYCTIDDCIAAWTTGCADAGTADGTAAPLPAPLPELSLAPVSFMVPIVHTV
ncbi:MAG: hypothetical protein ABJ056_03790, partial [Halioglobus sp.]